ncbi:MAG: ATP-dependent DNA ligase [Microcoleus sp. PH2017_39_LGB_O_B]|uniref:ATP-dependent DNA ligase n=1 Tax=unclassified Microcoleus TaxID=2642155 RepID=UPI001DDCB0D5|nr:MULTISPECIES: ATP-dependent DNA ligase [unclassified Microcoleus]MCC3451428.1 ATP-dependent DNA ligase [Microcoleus sp. PH2017_09_SFU_O_A]MCC3632328.1 ATP-dependent DNA ligase [Microcoleus sp. PH2017_39_LGB_O_B]MCC3644572.1 ATP-dependent DNA ligase [Microcoleus sp. PH2017_33_LGB_O_A]
MEWMEYAEAKRKSAKKISADIRERWNNRIVTRGLHLMGEAGAVQYLADYGRGIGTGKVISFALCAESEGYPEMAIGFWKRAFELETGEKPTKNTPNKSTTNAAPAAKSKVAAKVETVNNPIVPELPPHLQPGRIVTMQPVDAPSERSYYIENPDYWGQPKRDGNRVVVVATPDKVYYQSRSTNLRQQASIAIDRALIDTAAKIGIFVLDGELYYKSYTGSEHRTGAQAATVNIESGFPTTQPTAVYAIFKALFSHGKDLTGLAESERIAAGVAVGEILASLSTEFEIVPTSRTAGEKLLLAQQQEAENREGEVWVLHNCLYVGGKDVKKFPMVRTKYCQEYDLFIVGLTRTKVAGRPFSAIEVAQEINGKLVPIGTVGTGFSSGEMLEIARLYEANPRGVKIKVRSQGLTESGKLWHARFLEIC